MIFKRLCIQLLVETLLVSLGLALTTTDLSALLTVVSIDLSCTLLALCLFAALGGES